MLLPLMAIEKTAGIEPGKLLLHRRIQPLAGTAARVAALILGPEPVQHESQLAGTLVPVGTGLMAQCSGDQESAMA